MVHDPDEAFRAAAREAHLRRQAARDFHALHEEDDPWEHEDCDVCMDALYPPAR